jgi:hypothetical protein
MHSVSILSKETKTALWQCRSSFSSIAVGA